MAKLAAIFDGKEFLGVVLSQEVEEVLAEASPDHPVVLDDVRIEQHYEYNKDDVIHHNVSELIDDLHGDLGNTVIKN